MEVAIRNRDSKRSAVDSSASFTAIAEENITGPPSLGASVARCYQGCWMQSETPGIQRELGGRGEAGHARPLTGVFTGVNGKLLAQFELGAGTTEFDGGDLIGAV